MRALVPAIAGALLVLSNPAAAQHPPNAEAAIRAGTEAWSAAWNAGDAAALTALYAEDAVVMAQGAEPASGSAAIRKHYEAALAATPGAQNMSKTLEVMAAEDWAVEIGSFVANAADGSHLDHGRYTAVWKKVDGTWKLYRDMWNSSMR
jgi:uncharacterized protein (TIGR02246 family)